MDTMISFPSLLPYFTLHFSLLSSLLSSAVITLSGGEKIHPEPIEKAIKHEIPFLSNVMVVGNERKYLTCLMTLKVYMYICIYVCIIHFTLHFQGIGVHLYDYTLI